MHGMHRPHGVNGLEAGDQRGRGPAVGPSARRATPDRGGAVKEERDPRRWWALAIIDLCLLAVATDNTILNVALPTIARQLSASGSQLQWMVDAYILVFAGLILTSGTLGDRLGRKRLLIAGLLIFGLASAATTLVGSAEQLIAIRAVMGLGAALIMPATLSLITNLFDETERPKAIATWAAVSGLGMVAGPIVGGLLLDRYSWNAVFLVNIPVVAIGLGGALAWIPESRDPKPGRLDPVGAILSIAGLATLVYGIIEAPSAGWTAFETLARIGLGLGFMTAFVAWELHNSEPMLDIGLFARPAFGSTSFAETVAHFALVGIMFALTQYLQFVWGERPFEAGLSMLPVAFGVITGSVVATRLQLRFGARRLIAAGLACFSVSLALISRLTVDSPYVAFGAILFVMALGMGLAMAPATDSIMGAVEKERAGVGSATNDTTREIGSALGVAVFGSIMSTAYRDAVASNLDKLPGGMAGLPPAIGSAVRDSIGSASAAAASLPVDAGSAVLMAARQAFVSGMSEAALIGAVVIAIGTVILLHWLPESKVDASPDGAQGVLSGSESSASRLPNRLVSGLDSHSNG